MRGYLNFCWRIWPIMLFLAMIDVVTYSIAMRYHLQVAGPPLALLVVFVFCLNPFFLPAPELFDPRSQQAEPELTKRADELAQRAGVDALQVITFWSTRLEKPTAILKDRRVFLTKTLRSTFTSEMIDFVLAHEIAHVVRLNEYRRSHPFNKLFLTTSVLLLIPTFVCLRLSMNPGFEWPTLALLVAALLPMAPLAGAPIGPTRQLELWCDRKAVELTGDREAALRALEAMNDERFSKWDFKLSGYPTQAERLEQIRSLPTLVVTA